MPPKQLFHSYKFILSSVLLIVGISCGLCYSYGMYNHPDYYNEFALGNRKCVKYECTATNITTVDAYNEFDLTDQSLNWKYWKLDSDKHLKSEEFKRNRPPLKVIIVVHSHNDAGWLKTFEEYFFDSSRDIIDNVIKTLIGNQRARFLWNEISFLELWWRRANAQKRALLKDLVASGRLEITTGGWVMADEATPHLFAMVDQFIEGHQWLLANLNVTPTIGWSIDPFGHGSTMPYLYNEMDMTGSVVQRLHFAWKHLFAEQQAGDFYWQPFWKISNKYKPIKPMLTHNMPFDLYTTFDTCGPSREICMQFDFTRYGLGNQYQIDASNIHAHALELLEQYKQTAAMFKHNVAMILLGSDFSYQFLSDLTTTYLSYQTLIDYIMENKHLFNVEIDFGTPKDYFRAILSRSAAFPTLKGDFFVYADQLGEQPSYWSGYFTTRPFYKILCVDLERNLRAAEILYTTTLNMVRQQNRQMNIKILEFFYDKMIKARRSLAIFQHHDGTTGTSRRRVMQDYGNKLLNAVRDMQFMQRLTIEMLLQNEGKKNFLVKAGNSETIGLPIIDTLPLVNVVTPEQRDVEAMGSFVVFNSLAQRRLELITFRCSKLNIKVLNEDGQELKVQISPAWTLYGNSSTNNISENVYDVSFIANLKPLSINTYLVKVMNKIDYEANMASLECINCKLFSASKFKITKKSIKSFDLLNNRIKLHFETNGTFQGFGLSTITMKTPNTSASIVFNCNIEFSSYNGENEKTGAYLFKSDGEFEQIWTKSQQQEPIVIVKGSLYNEVKFMYGSLLEHNVRILTTDTYLDEAIFIDNSINFGVNEKMRNTEFFMRLNTDIKNLDKKKEVPLFYTDQNGFMFQKRLTREDLDVEANIYPTTTAAFIQDKHMRVTLLTTHAQGVGSLERGELEIMLDRHTLSDDGRGIFEAVNDNCRTYQSYILLLECMPVHHENEYQLASQMATQLSNALLFPPQIYFVDLNQIGHEQLTAQRLLLRPDILPCDVHVMNLRTISQRDDDLPSQSALLVLHRQGYDCQVGRDVPILGRCSIEDEFIDFTQPFQQLHVNFVQAMSLTGTHAQQMIQNFSDLRLAPMQLRTVQLEFQ